MCEGAKISITKNLDFTEKLVNGTIATIIKLDRVGNDIYGNPQGRVLNVMMTLLVTSIKMHD